MFSNHFFCSPVSAEDSKQLSLKKTKKKKLLQDWLYLEDLRRKISFKDLFFKNWNRFSIWTIYSCDESTNYFTREYYK